MRRQILASCKDDPSFFICRYCGEIYESVSPNDWEKAKRIKRCKCGAFIRQTKLKKHHIKGYSIVQSSYNYHTWVHRDGDKSSHHAQIHQKMKHRELVGYIDNHIEFMRYIKYKRDKESEKEK